MAWIESHQSLSRHRKTLKTAGRLSVDRHKLIGHLMELWWWALDNVGVEGRLTEMTHTEIASASQWEGDPQEFLDALIYGEFIDNTSEGLVLHDWYDYAGKLIESRERERERSRKRRETTSGQPAVDQRSTVGTVPNPTVPNSTNNKTLVTPVERRELRELAKGREEGFLEWWNAYPRKGDKKRTRKVWEKLFPLKEKPERLEQTLQNLWLHTEAYKREVAGKEKQYIKLPATFLNAIDVSEPPE